MTVVLPLTPCAAPDPAVSCKICGARPVMVVRDEGAFCWEHLPAGGYEVVTQAPSVTD